MKKGKLAGALALVSAMGIVAAAPAGAGVHATAAAQAAFCDPLSAADSRVFGGGGTHRDSRTFDISGDAACLDTQRVGVLAVQAEAGAGDDIRSLDRQRSPGVPRVRQALPGSLEHEDLHTGHGPGLGRRDSESSDIDFYVIEAAGSTGRCRNRKFLTQQVPVVLGTLHTRVQGRDTDDCHGLQRNGVFLSPHNRIGPHDIWTPLLVFPAYGCKFSAIGETKTSPDRKA